MSSDAVQSENVIPPRSLFDKLGVGLPIALTLLATTFASMSAAELQEAMFWRSAASQDQAKATSQWSLAGFKRDRALICETTAIQLNALAKYAPVTLPKPSDEQNNEVEAHQWLTGQGPPRLKFPDAPEGPITDLLKAIREHKTEAEMLSVAAKVKQKEMNDALDAAEAWNESTDQVWSPIVDEAKKMIDGFVKQKMSSAGDGTASASAAHAMKYDLEARRYRAESFFNQQIGFLYEARVKVSTAVSDKHRNKSKNFFYAMLAAQVGATISSLALARKQKSVLWLFASFAGIVSIAVGAVVYLM